ncbi:MAG: tetratricopeptide repeat protein [Planctomycetes bacterium]|nr:tetratricopeptide repeat protein [Planctomycetota bacterium]
MRRYPCLSAVVLLLCGTVVAWGQNNRIDDPPKLYKAKTPPTRQELDRRASLHLYVDGLLFVQEEKYREALKAFEDAARLDPDEPALYKAQAPILIGMDRFADAMRLCKKTVELDPGDHATWYAIAKIHKSSVRYTEAITALQSGLKSAALKDRPEVAQQIFFELASLFEITDQFGPAADAFGKAAAILEHPDQIEARAHIPRAAILARAAETYERIGQLYRKAKKYDQAIAAYAKAQERSPEQASRLNFTLAQIAEEKGSPASALKYIDAYLATRPLSTDSYETKVRLLKQLRKTSAIVPWLEEIAGRERFNTPLQLMLAREYAAAKLGKKAEAIYTKLAENSPSAELYRGLFRVYKDQGPAGMARTLTMLDTTIGQATRTDPPPSTAAMQSAKAMVGALREDGELAIHLVEAAFRRKPGEPDLKYDTTYFLAVLADQHRKNDEAERFYRRCLPQAKPNQEPVIYSGLLRVLGQSRKNEAVVALCAQGLKSARATNPLLFYRESARALAALRRYDEALRQADLGIKQAGDDSRLLFQLLRVRLLTTAHRFGDAEAECLALLKANDKPGPTVELRYVLSNIYSASKKTAKSEEQLQMILKIDPNNATVNNDLGYLWADQGKKLDVAEAMIRKALELDREQRRRNPNLTAADDKDNAAYVDSLGWVLFRRGQIKEARQELERAIKLGDGDDPVIHDHLGDVYNRLKMRPEAVQAWQRALKLYDQGVRGKDDERTRDTRRKIEQALEEIGQR